MYLNKEFRFAPDSEVEENTVVNLQQEFLIFGFLSHLCEYLGGHEDIDINLGRTVIVKCFILNLFLCMLRLNCKWKK